MYADQFLRSSGAMLIGLKIEIFDAEFVSRNLIFSQCQYSKIFASINRCHCLSQLRFFSLDRIKSFNHELTFQ